MLTNIAAAFALIINWILSREAPRYRLSPVDGSIIALPTSEQLAFQDREIGFIIHFEIATYLDDTRYDGCNSHPHLLPEINDFLPVALNVSNWVDSIVAVGGETATLVVKHNCGFTTWPTRVKFQSGTEQLHYGYSIKESSFPELDIAALFSKAASEHNVGRGFYYSLNYNNYLNYFDFEIGNETSKGQVIVTKETYNEIVFTQLEELWTSYGKLTEIWFDGGFTSSQVDRLRKLLSKHQPQAVVFNGCDEEGSCVSKHPIRWIGTEEGRAPEENWSTGLTHNGGDPSSKIFAPAECDVATYDNGRWFYGEHSRPRSISELVKIYHETVGRNCFLELGMSPNRDGLLPSDHVRVYKAFGDYIRNCYSNPLAPIDEKYLNGELHLNFASPVAINRIVLMEDQSNGQVIREYTVLGANGGEFRTLSQGTSVGHKKIDLFPRDEMVSEVKIVTKHVDTPKWRAVTLHRCDRI